MESGGINPRCNGPSPVSVLAESLAAKQQNQRLQGPPERSKTTAKLYNAEEYATEPIQDVQEYVRREGATQWSTAVANQSPHGAHTELRQANAGSCISTLASS